jgi:hypothetical protein
VTTYSVHSRPLGRPPGRTPGSTRSERAPKPPNLERLHAKALKTRRAYLEACADLATAIHLAELRDRRTAVRARYRALKQAKELLNASPNHRQRSE